MTPEPDPDPTPDPDPEPTLNTLEVQANLVEGRIAYQTGIRFSSSANGTDWLPFTTPLTTGDQTEFRWAAGTTYESVVCTVATSGTTIYPRWFWFSGTNFATEHEIANGVDGWTLSNGTNPLPWDPTQLEFCSTTVGRD